VRAGNGRAGERRAPLLELARSPARPLRATHEPLQCYGDARRRSFFVFLWGLSNHPQLSQRKGKPKCWTFVFRITPDRARFVIIVKAGWSRGRATRMVEPGLRSEGRATAARARLEAFVGDNRTGAHSRTSGPRSPGHVPNATPQLRDAFPPDSYRYAYVMNNPMNSTDPRGNRPERFAEHFNQLREGVR
jgi:hypothetical protein